MQNGPGRAGGRVAGVPLLLFVIWIALNGRLGWDVVVSGAAAAAAVSWFYYAFLGVSPRGEWRLARRAHRAFFYLICLVGDVALANLHVARIILSPRAGRLRPAVRVFAPPVSTPAGRLLLANSITLTPGTVTAGLRDGRLCVHALDEAMLRDLERSAFVRRIQGMEEGEHG